MTEPAGTVFTTIASTSVVAAVLNSIGLEPGPVFWSLAGASLGMSFAAATTRYRAVTVFVATALCCSLFGSWLAVQYFGGALLSRNAFSCGLAIFFHPLLNAAVAKVPVAIDGLLKRLGIGGA